MNITSNSRAGRAAAAIAVAAAAFAMLVGGAHLATASPVPPEVPQEIAVPAGNVLSGMGAAEGFQIYTCQAGGWVLQQPMAVLLTRGHKPFALHYGGPTWMAMDGSSVVAARAGSAPAPSPDAIPWLKLSATSTSGPAGGILAGTTFIQRINTTGGMAPATGCDAEHLGATAPVFYTADYYFSRAG